MVKFFNKRSYDLVKMFVNQIAISIFGFALALATRSNQPKLMVGTSIAAIIFYLFIIYNMMWEIGYKDKKSIERGDKGETYLNGLFMGLFASIPNYILAILFTVGISFPALNSIGAVAKVIALIIEGMYTGLLSLKINGVPLNSTWFVYYLTPIPLIVTSFLAYFSGTKSFKLFSSNSK